MVGGESCCTECCLELVDLCGITAGQDVIDDVDDLLLVGDAFGRAIAAGCVVVRPVV